METTISQQLGIQMKTVVTNLYLTCLERARGGNRMPILSHDPAQIFSQEELEEISDDARRIFFSYFAARGTRLRAVLTENPENEFDYLLVGIYCYHNGVDEQLQALLKRYEAMYVFTLRDFFTAIYAPYLPPRDWQTVELKAPDIVYLDGEPYNVLEVAHFLHGSPFLRSVTFHIGKHATFFISSTAQRSDNERSDSE